MNDSPGEPLKSDRHPHAPANPTYGDGVFRRRVRLRNEAGVVSGELEDSSHGFRVRIEHDTQAIVAIVGEALRYPLTTCPSALDRLQGFVGLPLDLTADAIQSRLNPKHQCTHLYDLAVWSYAHLRREEVERVYDIHIDDEAGSAKPLQVLENGRIVLEWHMRDWQIQKPAELAGQTIHRGFSRWMHAHYDNDEQAREYAWLAQKGYLVAQARLFDMGEMGGRSSVYYESMLGVCHSYTAGRIENATFMDHSTRDFTDCPEQLLRFE